MKHKLPLFAVITLGALVGVLALQTYKANREQASAPQPPPAPSQAFLENVRGELNNVAAGNGAGNTKKAANTVLAASSTKAAATSSAIVWNCTGSQASDFNCYEKYYAALTASSGIKVAFDDLKARYNTDVYAESQCHPLAHVIGRAASAMYATPGEAFTAGDSFCWSGYYHGVLEGIVGRIGITNLAAQINTICADINKAKDYSFDYYNCVHGLGHGVMALTNDELFQSLDYCDKLTGSWEQFSCGSGAYMENIIVDNKNHFTKYLKPSDPLYPCDASPEKYKNTCYLMQTSYMLKINGRNFADTFHSCSTVEPAYQDTCYQSLGRDASGQSTSNVQQTHDTCLLGTNTDQQANCIIGAVKDFVSYYHSDVQAKQLCASFSDQSLRDTCLATEVSYYSAF